MPYSLVGPLALLNVFRLLLLVVLGNGDVTHFVAVGLDSRDKDPVDTGTGITTLAAEETNVVDVVLIDDTAAVVDIVVVVLAVIVGLWAALVVGVGFDKVIEDDTEEETDIVELANPVSLPRVPPTKVGAL